MNYPLDIRFKTLALMPQVKVSDAAGQVFMYVKQKLTLKAVALKVYTNENQQKSVYDIVADKANTFSCGAPLEIKVTAAKTRGPSPGLLAESTGDTKANSQYMLGINANVAGTGGEIYSTFQKGNNFRSQPPKPAFTIVQTGGKTVANGNLEFG